MTVDDLTRLVDQQHGVYLGHQAATARMRTTVAELEAQTTLLTLTDTALATLLADVSQENLRVIEGTITYGLRSVFPDRQLTFKFLSSTPKTGPALDPVLVNEQGVEAPILEAFGGGPATVVAFLLRLLVAHRLGLAKVILLDEPFSMVSLAYLPDLAKFLKELAAYLGATFILVTHQGQQDFIEHADKAYKIVDTPSGPAFVAV